MKILIASNNKHKLEEIQSIFTNLGLSEIEFVTPKALGISDLDPEENGDTLEANASIKARAFFDRSQIATLADDTGFEVMALDGKPGVYSARYAGKHGDDKANRSKILAELNGIENRDARFRTMICFFDGQNEYYIEGICKGNVTSEEIGEMGFGYDSIFIADTMDKTFAEISLADKNNISHRGNAIRSFAEFIQNYLTNISKGG